MKKSMLNDMRHLWTNQIYFAALCRTNRISALCNECECFIGVSNTRKLMKARGRRPSAFIFFECLKRRWNTNQEFLKLLLQQKKISLNYHLNKFSQFNYYVWHVKYAWTSKKWVWCAWSYHLIAALWQFLDIQELSSCYLAVCQFWANTFLRKANGRMQIYTS